MPMPRRQDNADFFPGWAVSGPPASSAPRSINGSGVAAIPSPAHALQRRLAHSFEHGEPDLSGAPRYAGTIRIALLIGGPSLLWAGCFFLAHALVA